MIERHLRRVDPSLSGLALRRAVQEAFDSYTRYYIESFRLPTLDARARWSVGSAPTGTPSTSSPAWKRGNGVILALPHLGGWVWAGRWMTDQGHPLTVVVEPLQATGVVRVVRRSPQQVGHERGSARPDAGGIVLKALRDNHVVCLLW